MTRISDPQPCLVNPSDSSLFNLSFNPTTGIKQYFLNGFEADRAYTIPSVAPSGTIDGRYWWIFLEKATRNWTLAVVDFKHDTIRRAAKVDPNGPLPSIDPRTGVADVVVGGVIKRYDPRNDDTGPLVPTQSISVDRIDLSQVIGGLTRSSDGDRLAVLVENGADRCVATIHLPTGAVDIWHSNATDCNVIRFSPTDPTLLLYAVETPTHSKSTARAWLAREGLGSRPLNNQLPAAHRGYWWRPDGGGLWYVNPRRGIGVLDLERWERRITWPVPAQTAHGTRNGQILAAVIETDDQHLLYIRREDDSTVEIAQLSTLDLRRPYPTFEAGGRALTYSTIYDGRFRPAVTPLRTFNDLSQ